MRLLLDTHIWLWSLRDLHRLGARVLKEIQDPKNELWLSPISTWEALTLHDKGRLYLGDDLDRWLTRATFAFHEAVLTHEIVAMSRKLPLSQRDPADRFLAATALVLDLTLVTADVNLLGLGNISTLANR